MLLDENCWRHSGNALQYDLYRVSIRHLLDLNKRHVGGTLPHKKVIGNHMLSDIRVDLRNGVIPHHCKRICRRSAGCEGRKASACCFQELL